MPDAQYSFLPWLRRGIVGFAGAAGVEATDRLSVPLQLNVTGEGDQTHTEVISQTARLYGPGDVTGIDWSAIVRTTPHRGVRDFEANFLASIEFYDEDFLWRYTPAVVQAGKLQPWLWLVVLEAGEYTRQGVSARHLPVIDIGPEALKIAFPDPDTTWAWAHVHLNFALPGQPDQQTEARTIVTQTLDNNPNLGCSRLLCPRRLKANTRYSAFLIPAFEKGRLAGIGRPEAEIDQTPNALASWPAREAVSGGVQFPVYYEWEFSTSNAGDFENLARLLHPLDLKSLDPDANLLDLQEPGWGLRYRSQPDRKQPGAVVLESALRIPGVVSDLAFGKDAADEAFSKALSDLLNLGVEPVTDQSSLPPANKKINPFFGSNLDDDPVVVPPLYGSFYRQDKKLNPASTPPLLWYNQLNSNPVYRVAAGQGTAVVQQNQEEYTDRAWDQLRQHIETRPLVQRWQFSLYASQAFFAKRLASSLSITIDPNEPDAARKTRQEVQRFRAVNLTAPMHTRLKLGSVSFESSIRSSKFGAAYSSAFAKLTRSSGPLMRRFNDRVQTSPAVLFFNVEPTSTFPQEPPLQKAVTAAITVLDQPAGRTPPPQLPPNGEGMIILNGILQQDGLVGLTACKAALETLQPHLPIIGISIFAPRNNDLYTSIADQVRPAKTIPTRMRALFATTTAQANPDAERIDLARETVEFPEPMYRALAERSPDYIMPGFDRIPSNSVTLLEPNPAFIEAYLLGLNHEMAREFLWREFPVNLDGTFFRQFWDVRDNPAAAEQPALFKDITPVSSWGTTELGSLRHRPGGIAGNMLVVVIRSELLRKYPYTEVFMQKAVWTEAPNTQRFFREADFSAPQNTRKPLFSARVAPDYIFLGFNLDPQDAIGNPAQQHNKPGWYFALKERPGDVHFGMDLDLSTTDPSWPALEEVNENQCINAESQKFKNLPRYGGQADKIAAMLYQRPFVLYVHASRLLPGN